MRNTVLCLVAGLVLVLSAPAWANSWSDNFNGGVAQQTWTFQGVGAAVLTQDRLQMSTLVPPDPAALAGYVAGNYADVLMQARIQTIADDDNYLAYLLARANPLTMSGYVLGVGSPDVGNNLEEHLWLGKLTGGVYTDLASLGTQPDFNWTDCQVKFLVSGNALYGKVWSTGTTEPAGWQITGTDDSFASGAGGVMTATYPTLGWNNVRVAFDDVRLNVVPEPLTMLCVFGGVVGLGGYLRRRLAA
jgi:hypothetical protein